MINKYKQELQAFLTLKKINEKIKEIRSARKWNEKYFENKYVERVLYSILKTYNKTY